MGGGGGGKPRFCDGPVLGEGGEKWREGQDEPCSLFPFSFSCVYHTVSI